MNEEKLLNVANDVRRFLEPYYTLWHQQWGGDIPKVLSTYTCMRSSHLLKKALGLETEEALVVTGARLNMSANTYSSHAWVELDRYIIDITADQFGDASVLLLPKNDVRYVSNKEGFTIHESKSLEKTVNSLLKEWLYTLRTNKEVTSP